MKLLEKYYCLLAVIVLWIAAFLVYRYPLADVLAYHEQHHLFLFTSAYYQHTVAQHGFWTWIANFVIQFFYYPALGASVMGGLLVVLYLLLFYIVRFVLGLHDRLLLCVLPPIGFVLYSETTSHDLIPLVATVLILAAMSMLCVLLGLFFPKFFPLIRPRSLGMRARWWIPLPCLVVWCVVGYVAFVRNYPPKEGIMLKTLHYAQQRNWAQVLEYTNRYLQTGKSNQFILYFRNLALYHQGQLVHRLFEIPQHIGVKSLSFPWSSNGNEAEYGYFLYEQLGHLTEAVRWETEAMTVWGETAPHLTRLAAYYLRMGRADAAQVFINKLNQSLFHQTDRQKLLASSVDVPVYVLQPLSQSPARFSNIVNIGPELELLLQYDPNNKMAFEYLMCHLLLSNHLVRFAAHVHQARSFGYQELPIVFEEALMVYKTGVPAEVFARCGVSVSKQTEQRFMHYCALVRQGDMATLRQLYGNSYWFYINYISPYGHTIIDDSSQSSIKGVTQL